MDVCRPLMLLCCALVVAVCAEQASKACKHCVERSRQLRAQLRVHSAACRRQSGADPLSVQRLENGERVENPAPSLLRHVHCVLERCNVLKGRGRLAEGLLDKLRSDPEAVRAVELQTVDSCARTASASVKDLTWKLLRCGYNKALLLDSVAYQPGHSAAASEH